MEFLFSTFIDYHRVTEFDICLQCNVITTSNNFACDRCCTENN